MPPMMPPAQSQAFTPAGTGVVNRSIRNKLRDGLSVFDFGAVGDGVTDDTVAFQAAAQSGKRVLVPTPSAFYVINGTITFSSRSVLVGDEGLPTLKQTSAVTSRMISMVSTTNRAGLYNVTLNGNKSVTPSSECVYIGNGASYCTLENIDAIDMPGGTLGCIVAQGGTSYCRFHRIRCDGSESIAISLSGTSCQNNVVSECTFTNGTAGFGIRLGEGANRNILRGNRCTSNPIELIGLTYNCEHNIIEGNHAEGCGDNGISVSGNHNSVVGNVCIGNYYAGIGVWGCFNTVTGNIVLNNNQVNGNQWGGISILCGFGNFGQYNTVMGNACDDTQATPTQFASVSFIYLTYTSWSAGAAVTSGDYMVNGLNLYVAASSGTTGATAPTHTSGAVSDGGVSWTYCNTGFIGTGIRANGVIGNVPGRKKSTSLNSFYDPLSWASNYLLAFGNARWPSLSGTANGLVLTNLQSSLNANTVNDQVWRNGPVLSIQGGAGAVALNVGTGISAAGTTQGDATALNATYNSIATVAAGSGVILPATVGAELTVWNSGANTLNVYPPSGAAIDGGATDAAVTLAAGAKATYVVVTATTVRTK